MTTRNPFIPDPEFLERRSREMVDRERQRQDQLHGGWEHDNRHSGQEWAHIVDQERGQLAGVFLSGEGGRWGAFDRKEAIRQFIHIAATARRAAAVLMAEVYEAQGEHVDDDLLEMFQLRATNASTNAIEPSEEVPF